MEDRNLRISSKDENEVKTSGKVKMSMETRKSVLNYLPKDVISTPNTIDHTTADTLRENGLYTEDTYTAWSS
jgi:hypothetical protein